MLLAHQRLSVCLTFSRRLRCGEFLGFPQGAKQTQGLHYENWELHLSSDDPGYRDYQDCPRGVQPPTGLGHQDEDHPAW